MQYILSEQEYNELTCRSGDKVRVDKKELQKLCTLAAKHAPAYRDWSKSEEPWGCIRDKDTNPGYCDECPAKSCCPSPSKEFSK